jgi:hypothetical protein
MRVRHRIPSIFNLSMVDVLCCALGCVILLWLLNLRDAKSHQDSAQEQFRQTSSLLESARKDRDDAFTLLTSMDGQLSDLEQERNTLRGQLAALRSAHAELEGKWKGAVADFNAARKQNESQAARLADLEDKLKTSAGRVAALENDVRAGDKRYDAEVARAAELLRRLEAAGARLKDVQALADGVPKLKADLKEVQRQHAAEEALAHALEKEVAKRVQEAAEAAKTMDAVRSGKRSLERELDTRDRELALARGYKEKWEANEDRLRTLERSLTAVQDDRRNLQAEAVRLRAAAENRFAGIELTGRRVVFLVDMSGSMELVDEKTPAPGKWAEVGQTVARLMRSLPALEKYQVLAFAERVSYLLGGADAWLDYDPRTSPDRVQKALAATKPDGGTNMYAALETAFRLRGQGLDTIYLLSDGLPNLGEGLPSDPMAKLTEVERNDVLSRHIRRTLRTVWNAPRPGQPRVRINAVGFFFESPDVGAFLWALARENDGSFVGMSKP